MSSIESLSYAAARDIAQTKSPSALARQIGNKAPRVAWVPMEGRYKGAQQETIDRRYALKSSGLERMSLHAAGAPMAARRIRATHAYVMLHRKKQASSAVQPWCRLVDGRSAAICQVNCHAGGDRCARWPPDQRMSALEWSAGNTVTTRMAASDPNSDISQSVVKLSTG